MKIFRRAVGHRVGTEGALGLGESRESCLSFLMSPMVHPKVSDAAGAMVRAGHSPLIHWT